MDTIVISARHQRTLDTVQRILAGTCKTHVADSPAQLWGSLKTIPFDGLFIDIPRLEELAAAIDGSLEPRALIAQIRQLRPMMAIIIIAPGSEIRQAVSYMKNGASNYIAEPIDSEEVRFVLDEISRERPQQSELAYLRERLWQDDALDITQTLSPIMRKVYANVMSVGPTKTTVLLLGETGTGKSFMAKRIHRNSNRKYGPFISVHCGAIPDTLIESELFGHEKGSFTGAHRRKPGKFEVAFGGTIFLDEIGTISMAAQVKLLMVLQEGLYQRVGGDQALTANVRVIAASNSDLKQMCDAGQFRKDLYYRLNVFPITIPQLHERKEDIPFFVEAFLKKFNQFNNKRIQGVRADVMAALMHYDWPGNIRELENLMERAYILESSPIMTPDSFPSELFEDHTFPADIVTAMPATLAEVRRNGLEAIERRYLQDLLVRNRGRINASAAEAAWAPAS
ncbi:sigma-54-dependent transcriptional regulator [Desulfosarcina cetonica]|uniref:sigma-54-dependent transcriptional regulator n=1 Tax=Desulfosarcina cetonica TaxID=90730 RepID=UPI0006D0CC19|nr:sigma-54 dependent transcriptional regulator [Desulfosarcina cetonica]